MPADIIDLSAYRKPALPPEIARLAEMLAAAVAADYAPEDWNWEFAIEVGDLLGTVMWKVGRAMYGGSEKPLPIVLEP
jgi:hypothetical protein